LVVKNRIKVLETSQKKAQRAVEVARLKARKLKQIEQLRELENTQQRILLQPNHNKQIQHIINRAKSIGGQSKERVAINSIYDNTINAIKVRMQKQQYVEKIMNDKKLWAIENEVRRNKVIAMEQAMKQRVIKAKFESTEKIKQVKMQYYQDLRKKVNKAKDQLRNLENIERKMIKEIHNTISMENAYIKSSLRVPELIPYSRNEDLSDNYKDDFLDNSDPYKTTQ